MTDRTKPPHIEHITELDLPEPVIHHLDNGIPVYEINMGTQDVLKLELLFKAGRPFESKKLVSRATTAMLREGTQSLSSGELAEHFDFYGSSLNTPFNLDTTNFILYSLNRHFDKVLPTLAEMLQKPAFPDQELQNFKQRNQHRLRVDLSKNDVVAYRKITELIFGSQHPYGYNSFPDDYKVLTREDLEAHWREKYNNSNCVLIISGKIRDNTLSLINRHLGRNFPTGNPARYIPEVHRAKPDKIRIDHPDTVQTAIRIGRRLFTRSHPDFTGLYLLNTVLGGYFGSRLMANIREDKGYTYNIYSMLDTMRFDGFLIIATEVGNEFVDDTLEQIYLELNTLQQELIPEEELDMVRNYLLGNFLTMLDGPFNVSEVVKTLLSEELPLNFFNDLVRGVQQVDAATLRSLANKYLDPAQMWEVVVGE